MKYFILLETVAKWIFSIILPYRNNSLPVVATDASIKGASSELNSESDDADTGPAWWVAYQHSGNGRYERRICLIDSPKMKPYSEESFVSHFMEDHANSTEWMEHVDIKCRYLKY